MGSNNMPPAVEESTNHSTRVLAFHGSSRPTRGAISSAGYETARLSIHPTPHYPSLLRHVSTSEAQAGQRDDPKFSVLVKSFPQSRPLVQPRSSALHENQDEGFRAAKSTTSSAPSDSRPPKSLASTKLDNRNMTTKKRGRPFRKLQENTSTGPIPKKRGRPFRNPDAASSSDQLPKKRGRPFKPRHDFVDVTPPEPKFIPFLCEWKSCPAELHNLETLRAHIFTVHNKRQPSGTLTCSWENCSTMRGFLDYMTQPSEVVDKHLEFKKKEDWQNHIEKAHLVPLSWHMGDGPKATSLEKSRSDTSFTWLSDANGQQVTPSVKGQPIEGGRARDNNARRFVKKRDGLYVVLEPIKAPEAYLKTENYDDYDEDGDILSMDELG